MTLFHHSDLRILVAIPFHYSPDRLRHLAELIKSISEFPVAKIDIVLQTNTESESHLGKMREIFRATGVRDVQIETVRHLENPRDLTWAHKPLIVERFNHSSGEYSHFIYVEADIGFTFGNFRYWQSGREVLREHGLLPAFLRFEWREYTQELVSSDLFWPVYAPLQASITKPSAIYISMPNPYNPIFILDDELGHEYIKSKAIDKASSVSLFNWGIAERSAMGLCLVQVPTGFPTRYVVGLSALSGHPLPGALIRHLPDNYADNPSSPLGKVPMADLIRGAKIQDQEMPIAIDVANPLKRLNVKEFRDISEDAFYFLISDHDTILFLDAVAMRVRHGPLGTVPLNMVLAWSGEYGQLLAADCATDTVRKIVFSSQSGDVELAHLTSDGTLRVEYHLDDTVSIRINGRFLGADLDGVAYNDRERCFQWERYHLVPLSTLNVMSEMTSHRWRSLTDGCLLRLSPQPIHYGRARGSESSALAATSTEEWAKSSRLTAFGPALFSITDRSNPAEYRDGRIEIRSADGTVHFFLRQ